MKSIQSKILFVVISGLLVITAVVSMIAVTMTHEIMHKDADRILKNATQREAAYINDVLGGVMKSCSIMEHYAITELNNADDLKNKEYCDAYLKKAEIMFTEVALNTDAIDGFFMRIEPQYSDGKTGFYKVVKSENSIIDMPLTDLEKYDKDDKQNVGWYYNAVNSGRGVWLDPYYFPGNENQMISYVQPFYLDRNLVGVIGFDMNFSYLVERVEEISLYEDGYATLLARDGVSQYNKITEIDAHKPQTEAREELENGMFLAIHAAYKDIQRDIHPMLSRIVFAFILVLLCSIIYTILVTQKIVGPLKRLTSAAESLSVDVGSVDISRIPVDSKDEIGTLSRVLANTYAKIQEYTSYINALAYRDSLTGIKNSTAYTEAVKEINKEILTSNAKFGVLVADINYLKETNDKYGHDVGNELIVHASKILTEIFKNSCVFRIGGDEFAVIIRDYDLQYYHSLMGQMDKACSVDFITVSENTISVSVARGVAIYDPDIDRVYEDVFSKADQAMYMNKVESKAALPH